MRRGYRVAIYVLGAVILLAAAAVFRLRSTLPYLDQVRFHHWRYEEGMTKLAEAIEADEEFKEVYLLEGVVHASRGTYDVERLEGELAERYEGLFAESGFGRITRRIGVAGPGLELGYIDRFGRKFLVDLIRTSSSDAEGAECGREFRDTEDGWCEVRLGPSWKLTYHWRSETESSTEINPY